MDTLLPSSNFINSSSSRSPTIGWSNPRIEVTTTLGGFFELISCKTFIRLATVSLLGLNLSCGKVSQAGKLAIEPPR